MLHRLTAALLGLVLLVPAGAVTAPAASAAEDRAAPAAARAAAPRATVARTVRVGHVPVRFRSAGPKKTVRLTFRGTNGQFLNLALWAKRGTSTFGRPPCATWELRRGRHVVKPWAPGYWKIPRTATYVATVEPCERLTGRAQLRTVVLTDALLDGSPTQVGQRRGVTHLVRVGVPAGEVVSVLESPAVKYVILPDATTVTVTSYASSLALEAGRPVGIPRTPTTPGRHYLVPAPGAQLNVSRALRHEARVDGTAVTLPGLGAPGRKHLVSFTGQAGQWIYPELVGADGRAVAAPLRATSLLGPDLAGISSWLMTPCPGEPTSTDCVQLAAGPWQLPATGTYRMTVSVARSTGADSFDLRVRAATVTGALTVDGPAVTYAATSPGQWVVGALPDDATSATVATVGNVSSSLTDWRVTAVTGFPNVCGPRSGNGCPDYYYTELTPADPTQGLSSDYNVGPRLALLAVPPGVQGSLDLSLSGR